MSTQMPSQQPESNTPDLLKSPTPARTPPPKPKADPRKRRKFLQRLLGALGGMGFLGAVYPVIRYIEPPPESEGANRVEIDAGELPSGASRMIVYRGRPTVVAHGIEGYVAYMAVCPHLGCIVKWTPAEQVFTCPCHGGKFSEKGAVLGGPVPRPLTPVPVSVEGNKIIVGA